LHRFRIGLEFAMRGHRDMDRMIETHNEVARSLARQLGLDTDAGVIVLGVEADGPGDRAGVLVGDVLVALDGTPVHDTSDVLAALGPDTVGRAVPVRVIRGGAVQDLTITVAERPRGGGR
jgi:serine protease DegQ